MVGNVIIASGKKSNERGVIKKNGQGEREGAGRVKGIDQRSTFTSSPRTKDDDRHDREKRPYINLFNGGTDNDIFKRVFVIQCF